MTKKYIFTLLTVIVLVLSGCGDGGSSTSDASTSTGGQGNPFIGGDKGLEITFLDGAPPTDVYDTGTFPFDITLKVENVGEHDVSKEDVVFSLDGIDPSDFGKTPAQLENVKLTDQLRGAHKDAQGTQLPGTIDNVEFADMNFGGKITGTPTFNVRANVCYKYGTQAISQLCVLEDLIGRTRKSGEKPLCNPNEKKTVHNSGSPVQVTDFAQNVAGKDKVSFTFNIKHKGDGKNRISQKGSSCDTEIAMKDKVWVRVDTGTTGSTCSGLTGGSVPTEGFVKLFGEKSGGEERSVFCTVPLVAGRTDYNKQVKIDLEFDYKQSEIKSLVVKHTE